MKKRKKKSKYLEYLGLAATIVASIVAILTYFDRDKPGQIDVDNSTNIKEQHVSGDNKSYNLYGNINTDGGNLIYNEGNLEATTLEPEKELTKPVKLKSNVEHSFEDFLKEKDSEYRISADLPILNDFYNDTGSYENGCLIMYTFTNESDNDIVIEKFYFNAWDIIFNDEPVLDFVLKENTHDGLNFDATSISIDAYNYGWGPANDLEIELMCDEYETFDFIDENNKIVDNPYIQLNPNQTIVKENIFPYYFPEEKLKANINSFQPATKLDSIFTLNLSDKARPILNNYTIWKSSLQCQYNKNASKSFPLSGWIYLTDDVLDCDIGGISMGPKKYGLLIPIDGKPTYDFSKDIAQIIPAHKTKRLPFFFFADKSSSMTFNVTFETSNNNQPTITTQDMAIEFTVNSFYESNFVDGNEYIEMEENGDEEVYFPFKIMEDYESRISPYW